MVIVGIQPETHHLPREHVNTDVIFQFVTNCLHIEHTLTVNLRDFFCNFGKGPLGFSDWEN